MCVGFYLSIHVCWCMRILVYVCIYVRIIWVYTRVYACVYMYMCYVRMYIICIYISVCIYINVCWYLFKSACMLVLVYTCIRIYAGVHIYLWVYIVECIPVREYVCVSLCIWLCVTALRIRLVRSGPLQKTQTRSRSCSLWT